MTYEEAVERLVTHQFWTGKHCPRVLLNEPGGFEAFRERAGRYVDALPPAARADVTRKAPTFAPAVPSATASDEPPEAGGTVSLLDVFDPIDEAGTAGPDDGERDRLAHVERPVMENYELRRVLAGGAEADPLGDPEAD